MIGNYDSNREIIRIESLVRKEIFVSKYFLMKLDSFTRKKNRFRVGTFRKYQFNQVIKRNKSNCNGVNSC